MNIILYQHTDNRMDIVFLCDGWDLINDSPTSQEHCVFTRAPVINYINFEICRTYYC